MIITSIVLTFIGLLLTALGITLYRYFSSYENKKRFDEAKTERKVYQDSLNNEFRKSKVLIKTKTNDILDKLDSESSKALDAINNLEIAAETMKDEISNKMISLETRELYHYEIKEMFLMLDLKEEMEIDNFFGEVILVSFGKKLSKEKTRKHAIIRILGPRIQPPFPGFRAYGESQFHNLEEIDKQVTRYQFNSSLNKSSTIPIAISFNNAVTSPFTKIMDLGSNHIILTSTKSIKENMNGFRLVINTDTENGKLINVFSTDISEDSWLSYKIPNMFSENFHSDKEQFRAARLIDISNADLIETEPVFGDKRVVF